MPTSTAIALGTLLDPGSTSSSSASLQNSARQSSSIIGKRSNSPSGSPVEGQGRHPSASGIGSSSTTSSLEAYHQRPPGAGPEQQPVLLSRHQRSASTPTAGSEDSVRRHGSQGVSTGRGGGGRTDRAPVAGVWSRLSNKGYYISPKACATQESTRIAPASSVYASSSACDFATSPYVVNHKRRDISHHSPPPPSPSASDDGKDAGRNANVEPLAGDHRSGAVAGGMTSGTGGGCVDGPGDDVRGEGGQEGEGSRKMGEDENALDTNALDEHKHPNTDSHHDEEDDFFDPRELMSAVSSSDTEDGSNSCRTTSGRYHTPLVNPSEYYDASEGFFSDGSVSCASPSVHANIESDLCSIRYDLFEEIDRREKAEEALVLMQHMFQRIARQLSQVGFSFPPMHPGEEVQYGMDAVAQLCQEVVVTRFVSEAVEIGFAHTKIQAAAEAAIEAKNHEIARLQDRLQYYEAMNHEMSQRNQAAIELARCRRLKRKVWQRWVWGFVGLSITVGASLLVYSYVPHSGRTPMIVSSECRDSSLESIE